MNFKIGGGKTTGKPTGYGLQIRKPSVPKTNPKLSFDFQEDEEEESVNQVLQRTGTLSQKSTMKTYQKALEEDPTAFDYDDVYDAIQGKRDEETKAIQQEKLEKKSKYIEGLLRHSKKRELFLESVRERQLQKEREEEAEQYADKEKFVTSAYKDRLSELRQWEEEERMEEERDKMHDVTKKGDLSGFYNNLFTETVGQTKEEKKEADLKKEKEDTLIRHKLHLDQNSASKEEGMLVIFDFLS
eukprot:GCRY01002855.1.p1 GENE.GCRY01002855.1~~GCRY01002855.1.p1  ORF type:complete len:243 (+),score=47.74 GCRY01002855.1:137-865(+)